MQRALASINLMRRPAKHLTAEQPLFSHPTVSKLGQQRHNDKLHVELPLFFGVHVKKALLIAFYERMKWSILWKSITV